MTRWWRLVLFACAIVGSGCNKPGSLLSPDPTPKPTRVLTLSGDLSFGSVPVATLSTRSFTIGNTGNDILTISRVTVPPGFVSTWGAGTLYPGETRSVSLIFTPTSAASYSGAVVVAGNQTSGTGQIGLAGTGTIAAGLKAETLTGNVSGGDPMCQVGLPPYAFNSGPCQTFPLPLSTSGRVDGLLTYNGDDGLLVLELYDVPNGRIVAYGDFSSDPYPGKDEHSALSANMQPGTYQLRVRVISSTKIAPFTVITTHP